jgi:hypothetical protein
MASKASNMQKSPRPTANARPLVSPAGASALTRVLVSAIRFRMPDNAMHRAFPASRDEWSAVQRVILMAVARPRSLDGDKSAGYVPGWVFYHGQSRHARLARDLRSDFYQRPGEARSFFRSTSRTHCRAVFARRATEPPLDQRRYNEAATVGITIIVWPRQRGRTAPKMPHGLRTVCRDRSDRALSAAAPARDRWSDRP